MKDENGFTLIESLICLVIAFFIISLPVLSIKNTLDTIKIDLFFRELSSNITMMQNHAIINEETTSIQFIPTRDLIRFKVEAKDTSKNECLNQEIQLDESFCELLGNGLQVIYFRAKTGNSWELFPENLIQFKTAKGLYKLVFRLGSGRFEIRKI